MHAPPKSPRVRALIDRLKIYLRDNPTCSLKDAAAILNVKHTLVRKWKQFGWFEHMTVAAARRQPSAAAALPRENAKPAIVKEVLEYISPTIKPRPATPPRSHKKKIPLSVGAVVPIAELSDDDSEPDSIEAIIKRGQGLKISEIRAMVKAYLMTQVHDAKAVSNYAAGLRALSGVQDVELEDIYESEQMMKIYVPEEDVLHKKDVLEVDRIEY